MEAAQMHFEQLAAQSKKATVHAGKVKRPGE
jgi:isocitrate lyase